MQFSRRKLLASGLASTAIGALAPAITAVPGAQSPQPAPDLLPPAFDKLQPLGDRIHPITTEEFQGRLAHAQRLMFETEADPQMVAMYVTPGSSLYYFTGIRWGLSERLLALILPRKGEPAIVAPAFEADRVHEQLRWPIEVRVWQEDENPYAVAAAILADRGLRAGRIGIEETTRYVFFDGLRSAASSFQYSTATPVTMACRAPKSPAELELLRLANRATVDCYRAVFASLRAEMTERDVADLAARGFQKMGLRGFVFALFGQWAALPHGTVKPQKLREGDIVLIDDGCSIESYQADVTRTGVFGKPTDKQRRAFETVRRAQDAALAAAQRGKLSGSVDDAARAVIASAGYGKDYSVFTHRLGHGIGLDGHEHPYLVRGSTTLLEQGMTFSNEPGIYLRGEFGIRCEDCMEIVESGPAHLLTAGFSESLEKPCG